MPMLVYSVGVALGTEQWSSRTGSILAVVVGGVLLASYGGWPLSKHHNISSETIADGDAPASCSEHQ